MRSGLTFFDFASDTRVSRASLARVNDSGILRELPRSGRRGTKQGHVTPVTDFLAERGMRHLLNGCLCVLAVLSTTTLAQNASDDPDSNAGSESVTRELPQERIIYVPYHKLGESLEPLGASVIVPYADYLQLWTRVRDKGTTDADVGAVMTRAEYVARVEEDVAQISAELTIEVVGQPWAEVPIRFGDAAIGEVTGSDGEVLLKGTGDGTYSLLLSKRGRQRVRLELVTRVTSSPEGREISFEIPPVAVSTLELVIPQENQEVEVHPRLIQSRQESDDGQTRVTADLGSTGRIVARWHDQASAKPQMELLASVTNRQHVRLADGLVHTEARLEYDILRGEVEQVRLAVPKTDRVLDVSTSARIQKWDVASEANRQVVTVTLLSPVENRLTIDLHSERRLEGEQVTISGLSDADSVGAVQALDVVRESGQLLISHSDQLTARVLEQSGLLRVESGDAGSGDAPADAIAFRFFNPEFALTLAVRPIEPRVSVSQQAQIRIADEQLLLTSVLNYSIDRAGLFELRIGIPEDVEVLNVESEALDEYRVDEGTLVMSLPQQMTGQIAVTMTAETDLPQSGEVFELPIPQPLQADREQAIVQLFASRDLEVNTVEEEVEAAQPETLGAAQSGGELRAAWRFNRRPVRIPVTVTRKPTRLAAQVATDVDVQPSRTRVTTIVSFLVEYAGLDTFRIEVPEAGLPTLQIEPLATDPASPAIRETMVGDVVDGWVIHTLRMQRPVTGRQQFRLTYDVQPSEVVSPESAGAEDADAAAADDGQPGAEADAPEPPAGAAVADPDPPEDATDPDAAESEAADAETAESATEAAAAPATDAGQNADSAEAEAPNVPRQELTLQIVRPLGVEASGERDATPLTTITGEVRLQNEKSLTIVASAEGADIEPIDVRELELLPTQGTLAFRYRRHGSDEIVSVTITQARYGLQEMIATVVSRALVEIMLGEDEMATYRCRYRIKSTERQRLELRLPRGIVPLSVLVNGGEVRLEPVNSADQSPWDTYFVDVSRPGESNESFLLTLQFLLSFNQPPFEDGFLRGRLPAPLPIVGADDGSAATQELRTVVWVPEEYALIGSPSGFVLDGSTSLTTAVLGGRKRFFAAADDDAWIDDSTSSGPGFPTAGRQRYRYSNLGGQEQIKLLWWDTVKVTVVVSLALAIIAVVLVRTDWENKLGILLLIVFGAALLGLKDLHVLAHALSAMRFGLAFMVALWVLHGLFAATSRPHVVARSGEAVSGVTSGTPPHAAAVPPPGVFDHFLSSQRNRDTDRE